MPRRKNPWATLVIFLGVCAFGWASWHYLHEKRLFASDRVATVPAAEMDRLRKLIDDALASDECYDGVVSFNWREQSSRYRIDITMRDGCDKNRSKDLVSKVVAIVARAADGADAEVSCLVLGREVYHYVP